MKPIDPRGPRFNQAVVAVTLLTAFVLDQRWLIPVLAVVLFLGAAFGARWGPVLRVWSMLIRPRLKPPKHLEDPRPPRFAAALGTVFLLASTAAFSANEVLAWGCALLVAMLAGLAATSGLCIGCELYLFVARRRGVELVA